MYLPKSQKVHKNQLSEVKCAFIKHKIFFQVKHLLLKCEWKKLRKREIRDLYVDVSI